MSVDLVEQRIADIRSRLASLAPPVAAPAATAPVTADPGGTGSTGSTDFAAQLRTALQGPAPAAAAAVSTATTATTGSTGSTALAAVAPAATGSAGPTGADVVAAARRCLGVPYVWGGTSPKGFDCSGLVQWVYASQGVHLPRTAAGQAQVGHAVALQDAQPGDLVAFDNSRSRAGVDHIGIYIGDGKWIAAPHTGDVVKVQTVDLSRAVTIRRVLPARSAGAGAAHAVAAAGPGTAAPGWAAALPAAARPFVPAFAAAARATGVDPRLLASVAWTESAFRPGAHSGVGAVGLMQLMPRTAAGLGVDPRDPAQAVLGAARYLRDQLQAQHGRLDLALAAYNAGPGAVRQYGGIPPYAETRRYVSTVLSHYTSLGGSA